MNGSQDSCTDRLARESHESRDLRQTELLTISRIKQGNELPVTNAMIPPTSSRLLSVVHGLYAIRKAALVE